jgi:hypothetical protein
VNAPAPNFTRDGPRSRIQGSKRYPAFHTVTK